MPNLIDMFLGGGSGDDEFADVVPDTGYSVDEAGSPDWFSSTRVIQDALLGGLVGGGIGFLTGGPAGAIRYGAGGAVSGVYGSVQGQSLAELGRRHLGLSPTEAMVVDIAGSIFGGEKFFTNVAGRGLGRIAKGDMARHLLDDINVDGHVINRSDEAARILAKGYQANTQELTVLGHARPEVRNILNEMAAEKHAYGNVAQATVAKFWDVMDPMISRTRAKLENSPFEGARVLGKLLDEKPIQQYMALDRWRPELARTGVLDMAKDKKEQFWDVMERHVKSAWKYDKEGKSYSRARDSIVEEIVDKRDRITNIADYDPEVVEIAKRTRVVLDDIAGEVKDLKIRVPGGDTGKLSPFVLQEAYMPHISTFGNDTPYDTIRKYEFTRLANRQYKEVKALKKRKDLMDPAEYELRFQQLQEDDAVRALWHQASDNARQALRYGQRTTSFQAITRKLKYPLNDLDPYAAKIREKANKVLNDPDATPLKKEYWRQKAQNIDRFVGGLDRDPVSALATYVDEMASMLGAQKAWGPKYEALEGVLSLIPDGPQRDFAANLIDLIKTPGRNVMPSTVRFAGGARSLTAAMSMLYSSVVNASQMGMTMAKFGPGTTFKSVVKYFKDPEVRLPLQNGHLAYNMWQREHLDGISGMLQQGVKKFLKYTGFTATEYMNRAVTNLGGRMHFMSQLEKMAAGTLKHSDALTLNRSGVNMANYFEKLPDGRIVSKVDDMLEEAATGNQGVIRLIENDAHRYGLAYENRIQFNARPMDIPFNWNHPLAKVLTQFKTFALNQTGLLKDMMTDAIKAARHGDLSGFEPLLRAGVYLPTFGAAVRTIRDGITGADWMQTKTDEERVLQYFMAAGGVGILTDLLSSLDQPYRLTEMVAGPFVGQSAHFLSAMASGNFAEAPLAYPTIRGGVNAVSNLLE